MTILIKYGRGLVIIRDQRRRLLVTISVTWFNTISPHFTSSSLPSSSPWFSSSSYRRHLWHHWNGCNALEWTESRQSSKKFHKIKHEPCTPPRRSLPSYWILITRSKTFIITSTSPGALLFLKLPITRSGNRPLKQSRSWENVLNSLSQTRWTSRQILRNTKYLFTNLLARYFLLRDIRLSSSMAVVFWKSQKNVRALWEAGIKMKTEGSNICVSASSPYSLCWSNIKSKSEELFASRETSYSRIGHMQMKCSHKLQLWKIVIVSFFHNYCWQRQFWWLKCCEWWFTGLSMVLSVCFALKRLLTNIKVKWQIPGI